MPVFGLETVSRTDPVYKACLTVTTAGGAIIGGATGSFLDPVGSVSGYLGGAACGLSAGYLVCPFLAPAIKRIFELGQSLTDQEVSSAANAMSRYTRITSTKDVLRLVAIARTQAVGNKKAGFVFLNPFADSKKLLTSV